MQDLVGVQVDQCLGHVQRDVDLNVEEEGGRIFRPLQEAGQALVHQFHQKHRVPGLGVQAASEVLDDVWVAHFAEEATFLFETLDDATGGGVPRGEEDWVQHLGGAGELVTSGLVYGTVGANPEGVILALDQVKIAVAEGALDRYLSSHTVYLPYTISFSAHRTRVGSRHSPNGKMKEANKGKKALESDDRESWRYVYKIYTKNSKTLTETFTKKKLNLNEPHPQT